MKERQTRTIAQKDAALFASSFAQHLGQALKTQVDWDIKFHDVAASISLSSKQFQLEFSFDQKHTEIAFFMETRGCFNVRLTNLMRLIAAQRPDLANLLLTRKAN